MQLHHFPNPVDDDENKALSASADAAGINNNENQEDLETKAGIEKEGE